MRSADVRFGVLGTTIVAFFLAEMGDKTQIARSPPRFLPSLAS